MGDSPIFTKSSSHSPRSPLTTLPSPSFPSSSPPSWAWKSTSPALGPRRGLYAGRRGSMSLDESSSPPPSSPSSPSGSPPSLSSSPKPVTPPVPSVLVMEEQPRKGTNLPKCLSSEHIELPRFRKGSAEAVQKQILKMFKKDDTEEETTTSTMSSTPPSSPTALSSLPTSPSSTKLRPLIRIDSFGPEKLPVEEPAHVRRLRDDVKDDVIGLIRARKLHALEAITSFHMKDSKNGKYTKTFIRLAKNHQVLQFGNTETVTNGESSDVYFPLKIQVSNISLVEDRTPKDPTVSSESVPAGYHIWLFDKVHRGEYDLITSQEYDFVAWFEGLKALVGNGVEVADGPTVKMLSDLEVDMRLYYMEEHTIPSLPKSLPKPILSANAVKVVKGKEEEEGWELWRKCYADLPDGEDCFNFATYQHPLFISS